MFKRFIEFMMLKELINFISSKIIFPIGKGIRNEYKILLFFLFTFLLMIILHLPQENFIDEMDNFLGARTVSEGGVIYKDFYSQHMPVKYYILSIFVKLGADTIPLFRISYYFIFSIFFIFVYFRYKKYFGYKTLLLFPVLFILDIARHNLMYTVLSDGFQAMALLLLFMEFYVFSIEKPNKFSISNILCISFSIFVAIGVAFLSIYSIAIIFLGVLFIEIEKFYSEKTMTIKNRFVGLGSRYIKLYLFIGILVFIYLLYFIFNGAFNNMIYQSYTFNIEVYSKYTNNFNSKIKTLINTVVNYGNHINGTFSELYTIKFDKIISTLLLVSNIGVSFIFFKKNKILSFITLLFAIYTGIRGYTGFHSTAYIIFSWFCLSYLIDNLIINKKKIKSLFFIIFISIITFLPLYSQKGNLDRISEIKHIFKQNSVNYYVNEYVSPGDYIFSSALIDTHNEIYRNQKIASRMYALVPWFAEVFILDLIEDLKKNKPKIIFYDSNETVWGYRIGDYCQPLEDYLNTEYNRYFDTNPEYIDGDSHRVWLHNSISSVNMISDESFNSSGVHVGEITNNVIIKQKFKSNHNNLSQINIFLATFARNNTSDLTFQLLDDDSKLLAEEIINTTILKDNNYRAFKFESIKESLDKYFVLRISSPNATPGNAVTIWRTDSESFNGELVNNNILQEDNLCIVPGYLIE